MPVEPAPVSPPAAPIFGDLAMERTFLRDGWVVIAVASNRPTISPLELFLRSRGRGRHLGQGARSGRACHREGFR